MSKKCVAVCIDQMAGNYLHYKTSIGRSTSRFGDKELTLFQESVDPGNVLGVHAILATHS